MTMNAHETKETIEYFVDKVNKLSDEKKELSLQAKYWNIVKKKLVDVFKLYNCKTVEEYNQAQYRDCMLTEEEFNTLKEGLRE